MINRRRFLIVFIGLTISGVAVLFVLRNKLYNLRGLIARLINPRLDEDSPVGILSEEEMKTIIALSEVLIPTVEKSGANSEFSRSHVNYKTKNVKGYLKEYRNAEKLLQETSKKVIVSDRKFYELNLPERDRVLGSILWRYRSGEFVKPRLERIFSSRRKMAFRDFVVRDILIASFQQTPVGWAIVGYCHYPGVPAADPRDYTKPLELTSQ
jgi:hypothetical protein